MKLTIYLAGEIHSNWRGKVKALAEEKDLSCTFVGPQENHGRSDEIGEMILGSQPNSIVKDEAASRINNLRTQVLMEQSNLVIALFGDEYKQWNTAMDVSAALTAGKPVILIRPEHLHHPLKELSNKANVTVETIEQALSVVHYIFE
ncbi:hypothetical protein N781_09175 [Pontibacillus halophilus JSM 076056 = DSM 19796]|uniref:YtoQ family protein n=1 Tax=Pontibacillus halophilus JSM 076056 = DSM 19796 TaxID=1385510 RepID=A0A0A5I0N9_9BACI|nr:YtoQ family protein [Pontibacillus halophilus]KGX89412.1 hypothetical protein N781_09175 [Pontibacillus halophilus JSM 076056 = DSM 19796]